MKRAGLLSMIMLAVMGCQHVENSPASGSVTSRAVRPYNSPVVPVDASKLQLTVATDVFQEAKLLEPHEEPRLPEGWETQLTYPLRLNLKVLINEKGEVTLIERSMLDVIPAKAIFGECYAAIQQAVTNWKFAPAVRAHVRPGLDGKPVVTSQQEIDTILYFEFRVTSNRMIEIQQKS